VLLADTQDKEFKGVCTINWLIHRKLIHVSLKTRVSIYDLVKYLTGKVTNKVYIQPWLW